MSIPHSRQRGTWSLAGAALLALALPAQAAENSQQGEVIIIQGDDLPDCAVDVGIGYTEVFNTDGSFAGCACVDPFYCGSSSDYPGGGGPESPGGGYGPDTPDDDPDSPDEPQAPDDDCTDGGCVCEAEDPEPEWCEIPGCAECSSADAKCVSEATEDVTDCINNNKRIAYNSCMASLGLAPDLETCMKNKIYGTPGTEDSKGHSGTITGGGGASIEVDLGGVTLGGNGDVSGSSTDSDQSSTSRPYVPSNEHYANCELLADMRMSFCAASYNSCVSDAEEYGEACDEH